ncbi:hypothetical protein Q4555_10720 [Octadecabacter sp. 1_MG-2023]|uniref:hypothetical protein n=1 Tax=unclassified Octadecabacter TaxID=196158 RepID=UPI001C08C95F|nr:MULTISPECIES: hypothetical protein [unclassified Octadecabacter]MBU2992096.1 hypothetical protein [Octadecabacter sp. B2R22]MDO6735147.1 hypothetical protein [Octadecabacter sp. 1_MG-2023]
MPYSDDFSPTALEPRITVLEGSQIIEIVFTGLYFHTSADVNAFYDYIETRIVETGEGQWFFMVNTEDYRVDGDAWFAFTRRGLDLNEGHGMKTVRYDADPMTVTQIERAKGTERENPNLFGSREDALEHLKSQPSKRRERLAHHPSFEKNAFMRRLTFIKETGILEIDLSGMSFEHSRDVNDVHNWAEEAIRASRQKWWMLFNYEGTRIQSPAWVQFSVRSEEFNKTYSMGSVRYALGSETEADKRLRYEAKSTRPNIRNTHDEALERLEELRAEYAAAHPEN